jgi:hypothetical protein
MIIEKWRSEKRRIRDAFGQHTRVRQIDIDLSHSCSNFCTLPPFVRFLLLTSPTPPPFLTERSLSPSQDGDPGHTSIRKRGARLCGADHTGHSANLRCGSKRQARSRSRRRSRLSSFSGPSSAVRNSTSRKDFLGPYWEIMLNFRTAIAYSERCFKMNTAGHPRSPHHRTHTVNILYVTLPLFSARNLSFGFLFSPRTGTSFTSLTSNEVGPHSPYSRGLRTPPLTQRSHASHTAVQARS